MADCVANLRLVVEGRFKIFISWSGQLSKAVASVWRDLIAETFDTVDPFMSEEDIGAGTRGLPRIATELAGTSFGIILVTQENQNSPWINYEAGALSKDVGDETVRVAPVLVDFERKNDVTGPIGQFQAGLLDREGVEFILVEIAQVVQVNDAVIRKRLANSWSGEYEARFAAASAASAADGGHAPLAARRDLADVADEILTVVRDLARSAGAPHVRQSARHLVVLAPGDAVSHDKYGLGIVEEVTGDGDSAMSLIDFGSSGRVKLMHNHAPVTKVEPPDEYLSDTNR